MEGETIKNVNFPSFLFASLIAGYTMLLVDYVFSGWFGFFGLYHRPDSHIGLSNPYWTLKHEVQSVIFSLPYAIHFVRIEFIKSHVLKGVLYGIIFYVFTRVVGFLGMVGGASWLVNFMDKPLEAHVSSLVLHIVWGFFLGYLYNPPSEGKR
ncbi:MAG: hypothetical protein ABWK04_08260 [Hydrogenobacter sp.]|uniref:hypothetical protein n=1 Tax=Hydrogenobacter thermophilus TaxID=940 RepID=UPI0030F58FD3